MFFRKKYATEVITSQSIKDLAKRTEKSLNKRARDGYVMASINDEKVSFLGITTETIRTITYRRVAR